MANTTKKATTSTTAKAATTKAAKKAPERELDWRAIGIVQEHRSAKQRGKRRIDKIRAQSLAYVASAFIFGMSIGTMLMSWLH